LDGVIKASDMKNVRTYLRWHLLLSTPGLFLPYAADQAQFEFFNHKLRGQLQPQPRWHRCVSATSYALELPLAQVYIAHAFPASSKAAVTKIAEDVESAMRQDINEIEWMSSATKARATEKLAAVTNKIGYPDEWRDESALAIVKGDAYGNYVRGAEFFMQRKTKLVGNSIPRGEFSMSPVNVNAQYSKNANDITMPAGILQLPFYDPNAADAINYGHVGSVIGHELTHGFDDSGRRFDALGNMVDWWSVEDSKAFEERKDCMVHEYDNFKVGDNLHVNGALTVGENIADNGGLRLSYLAFLLNAKREGLNLEQVTDGLSVIQRFFIAFGQNFCSTTRPEQERLNLQTNEHSPDQFRINGPARNLAAFGQAFGCKLGQPMMPTKACRVW